MRVRIAALSLQQRIALLGAPAIVAFMLGIYAVLARCLPREQAWLAGFFVYWPVCCLGFPLFLLGRRGVAAMFRPARWSWGAASGAVLPVIITFAGRFIPHGEHHSSFSPLILAVVTLLMALFEELLWRGTYHELFASDWRWSIAWPTVWFAAWHFAPGSVSTLDARVLAAGALCLGVLLGWITRRTGSIRWGVLTHAVAGLVRML